MIELPGLVPRHAESLVTEALADTRVVLVNGARQAGKSTLTRLAAGRQPGAVIRLLDDPATHQAAKDDPTGFVDHEGQGEISGEPDRFVDAAFRHGPRIDHSSPLRRRNYLDRLVVGGFPEAVRRASRR